MAATPQVQYVLGENGVLDIRPSGKQITLNGDTSGDGTLTSKQLEATDKFVLGSTTTLTLGTLSGTIHLGDSGALINSTGKITGLSSLTVDTLSSGLVTLKDNDLTGVSSLNSNELKSNNFVVSHSGDTTTAVTNVTTLTHKLQVGNAAGATATLDLNTLTGLATLNSDKIISNAVTIESNNMSGVATLTASQFTDSTATLTGGRLTMGGGSITGMVDLTMKSNVATSISAGNGRWQTSTDGSNSLTSITTVSASSLTDTVATITSGVMSGVQNISALAATINNGTVGDMTLVSSGIGAVGSLTMKSDGTSKIINVSTLSTYAASDSTLTNGGGSWISPADSTSNTLTGVTKMSASTVTDTIATLNSGSLTSLVNLVSTAATITGATIASVVFSEQDVSNVQTLTASDVKVGTSTFRNNAGVPEITGLGSFSCATITDTVASLDAGSLTGLVTLTGTDATVGNATLSTLAVSSNTTLSSDNLTGLASLNSSVVGIGAMALNGPAANISGVTAIDAATLTSGSAELSSNTLTGLTDATLSSTLKVGSMISDGLTSNVTGVNQLDLVNLVSSGTITGAVIKNSSGNFRVIHDGVSSESTVTSDIYTDGVSSLQSGTLSGISKIEGGANATASLTSATLGGITLSSGTIASVTELKTSSITMLGGNVTGAGVIQGDYFSATNPASTSTIKGHLRVEGDLKVINDTAKVIELTHEKFSTQDPVLEFNTRLDTNTTANLNTDFGFINVCSDSSSVLKFAGLLSDVDSSDTMEFTFFHSATYNSAGTNNTLPSATDYTRANLRCKNVSSDGYLNVTPRENESSDVYVAVGPNTSGRASGVDEVVYANGNMRATGSIDAETGFKSTAGTINIGTASQDSAKIRCDGLIKTLSIQTQNFTQTSDARKKENVKTIDDSVATLQKLRPVTFDWKEGGKSDVGFIAQEVKEVYPELVAEDGTGHFSVAYTGLVAPLVRAVQQQQEMILALEARLAKLEA
tara:strand:+ start:6659 stop:9622 length:2964 start_codon:yes stop_codon:yes gene_type:complete